MYPKLWPRGHEEGRSRGATWQCGRKRKRERGNSSIESQLTSKKRTKKNKKEQGEPGEPGEPGDTKGNKGNKERKGKHDGAKVLAGSKRNRRCAQVVHQTEAVTLGLPHFLQQLMEVFLEGNRSGMLNPESLLGTTYGLSVEWLSFIQFPLSLE